MSPPGQGDREGLPCPLSSLLELIAITSFCPSNGELLLQQHASDGIKRWFNGFACDRLRDAGLAILEQVARKHAHYEFVPLDDTGGNKFAHSRERRSRSRFAAEASAVDHGFGGENFLVADLLHNAITCLDDAAGARIADRVANFNRSRNRISLNGPVCGKILHKTAIEGVGSACLDSGYTRHMTDQRELVRLAECLANRGDIAEIASGQHQPVGGLPIKLL